MTNRKELLREFLLMNLGTLLVSVGVYFFKFPNHFSMGGVSGLAVLLGKLALPCAMSMQSFAATQEESTEGG